jgi:hypothetical protein
MSAAKFLQTRTTHAGHPDTPQWRIVSQGGGGTDEKFKGTLEKIKGGSKLFKGGLKPSENLRAEKNP